MATQINGGFFWAQQSSPIVLSGTAMVSNVVVCGRPRWYQVRRWYRAFRLWLALPYDFVRPPSEEEQERANAAAIGYLEGLGSEAKYEARATPEGTRFYRKQGETGTAEGG